VATALAAGRLGFPLLIGFLGLGMLLGSDGPGGIEFDDAELARTVGVVGLTAILFEGGLTTSWRRVRPVIAPVALLSTVGVVVSALITGLAAYALFDVSPATAVLLGAVVSSTDAAAVFATLRFTSLRRRLTRLLEAESGGNDPMAVALTVGLLAWITEPNYGVVDLTFLVVRQLGIGLAIGVVLGIVASWAFERLPRSLAAFAPVASVGTAAVSFGAADVAGGSGFLSVYIVGLSLGGTSMRYRRQLVLFHQGLAYVAQVVLFVVLGLLVFPHDLPEVILSSLALTAVLSFVARPAAVWLCTARQRMSTAERAFIGWAGLRGAVPIVLGTFVLDENIEASETIFNAVFFVVLASTLLQGTTIEWAARRLGLATGPRPHAEPPLEIGGAPGLEIVDFVVGPNHALAGRPLRDAGVPRSSLVAVIMRGDQAIPPRGSTVIEPGDRLYVLSPEEERRSLEELLAGWRRSS
jgi:potassium/hydrogen antiporter